MKKLFILILLISFSGIAQKKSTKKTVKKAVFREQIRYTVPEDLTRATMLKEKDFTINLGKVNSNRVEILFMDGSEKPVSAKFLFSSTEERYLTLGLQKINIILYSSNLKTILKMKNKYTYQPRKISLFYSESSKHWTCSVEYTSQNDYGAIKDGQIFYTYTDSGVEIDELGN